jgi:phosphoribosylformylglycinamidine synthase
VGVITFPGTLDDVDAARAVRLAGAEAVNLWHADADLKGVDGVVVPGGFSYGDYLRCGAIAARSPAMREVARKAAAGVRVLGVCNGFQILTEAGLLPGALMRNASLKFLCREVRLRVEAANSAFTSAYDPGQVIRVPVAHGEGNYTADEETLKRLEGEGLVAFRYSDAQGHITQDSNRNGSMNAIAGIYSDKLNVLGMMPHPENLIEDLVGGTDGRGLFESLVSSFSKAA